MIGSFGARHHGDGDIRLTCNDNLNAARGKRLSQPYGEPQSKVLFHQLVAESRSYVAIAMRRIQNNNVLGLYLRSRR
jgi:hypothetical protein